MASYLNLRIASDLGNRFRPYAEKLKWSDAKFTEEALRTICEMIEQPLKRVVPDIVIQIDALKLAGSPLQSGIAK